MSQLKRWKHLKIPLKEIKKATENFQLPIGRGGYGLVYKGELVISGKPTTVAIKRLEEQQYGQGLKEFLTEIQLLSGQNHPNVIQLIGYCDEKKEKILVYEYAERGSLDMYLTRHNNTTHTLTWLQRLKICVDAARGLEYLHNYVGVHQTIIHRDIKSANILIDENWVAKVSDLGLSKLSLAGLNRSEVISQPCGTRGYCDPQYMETSIVTKESDVFSFGIVLFEVLSGRLCHEIRTNDGLDILSSPAKGYYLKHSVEEIVDSSLEEEMNLDSMNKFAAVARRCLDDDRGQRPPMADVVKELEESLDLQMSQSSCSKCYRKTESNQISCSKCYSETEIQSWGSESCMEPKSQISSSPESQVSLNSKSDSITESQSPLPDVDDIMTGRLRVPIVHNPTFSQKKRQKLWQIFKYFDFDNDGALNSPELKALIDTTHPNLFYRAMRTLDDAESYVYTADQYVMFVDNGKGLTFDGFLKSLDQLRFDVDHVFSKLRTGRGILVLRFLVGLFFIAIFLNYNQRQFSRWRYALRVSGHSAFLVHSGRWLLRQLKNSLDTMSICFFCYFCFVYVIRPIFKLEKEAPDRVNYDERNPFQYPINLQADGIAVPQHIPN